MSARGVTLTELIVGITILGILAWIAYPKITAKDEIKLDAAARRLASDLRYAQSRAIGTRVVHGLYFEPAVSRYTVFAPNVASPVTDPADRARTLQVDFTRRTEFKGIAITSASFGATRGVTFDYYGVPRDSAGTDLTSTGRVILTYQGLSDTVDVAPTTGKVVLR
ncbi:MAG TPA: prepilin-type N-terminal cleavage/methylation domain-containing protein [Candidatus Eisenbacteria bacterium]|jgi:prepilin-type N-terminal cleavage/methylation domain-containing protein|nr:prepilin-type N-terminal cleavage/methylation domain-containing protein [Candidatus Eisenbacteria bacterium]